MIPICLLSLRWCGLALLLALPFASGAQSPSAQADPAGGFVFTGDGRGNMVAFDAANGELLYAFYLY